MTQKTQLGEPEDRSFISQLDGTRQLYVLMRPEPWDPKVERHLLIALHGFGGDRWQFAREARGECRAARDTAARYGMLYVSPDYRGNSRMSPAAEADMIQLINELREEFGVKQVFLTGGSMGATSSLAFTAMHPDLVHGVCALNGVANLFGWGPLPEVVEAMVETYGGTPAEVPLVYKARSAEYWPERFTMPVAITTGGKDELDPPASTHRLVSVLQVLERPVLLIHREETGHETNYEDTCTALEFVVKTALAGG